MTETVTSGGFEITPPTDHQHTTRVNRPCGPVWRGCRLRPSRSDCWFASSGAIVRCRKSAPLPGYDEASGRN